MQNSEIVLYWRLMRLKKVVAVGGKKKKGEKEVLLLALRKCDGDFFLFFFKHGF